MPEPGNVKKPPPPPAAAASSSKRRKRGGRNRGGGGGGDRSGAKKFQRRGLPQSPQLKVTVRNIRNAALYGTCQALSENLLAAMVKRANAEKLLLHDTQIVLDEVSVKNVVEAEQAACQARAEWEQQKLAETTAAVLAVVEDQKEDEKKDAGDNGKKENAVEKLDSNKPTYASAAAEGNTLNDQPKDGSSSDFVEGMEKIKTNDPESIVTLRVLYMVPPKKTRRRGEKPGCIYLLLMTPPIKASTPAVVAPRGEEEGSTAAPAPPADYSKHVARRRLMLQRVMDALMLPTTRCGDATTTAAGTAPQDLPVVEESPNARTWKPRISRRRDRLEGTLQDSADYQSFFEDHRKQEEARKTRPKPPPGGGAVAPTAVEQPVAALVLHLRQKKEEEKKRQKKKSSSSKATTVATIQKDTGAAAAANHADAIKKKRKHKKKKKVPVKSTAAG